MRCMFDKFTVISECLSVYFCLSISDAISFFLTRQGIKPYSCFPAIPDVLFLACSKSCSKGVVSGGAVVGGEGEVRA